jgi:cysteinyl-tRNA synthetase
MSMQYLGQTFDIHGGGMDLLFPHHENELAQSECATGKPFAKFWMHNGLTRLNTKKMSGSIGNVVAVTALLDQHGPELLRYMLLTTHYRRPIDFSDEVIQAAKKGSATFFRLFERAERLGIATVEVAPPEGKLGEAVAAHRDRFVEMMDDDFNTAGAIGVLHDLAGEINSFIEQSNLEEKKDEASLRNVAGAVITMRQLGQLLGLFRTSAAAAQGASELVDQLMNLLIDLRREARAGKNFALADSIRKRLSDIGVTLEDRADGTIWRRS